MAVPKVQIFFGSQSGTAECFSEELREEAQEQGVVAEVVDLEKFCPEDLSACKIAVLIVATYGDGEATNNAVAFHKWASDPRHNGALKGLRFCVMGLGDMNYARFNNMGISTDQNLERLGGKRIFKLGLGDDSQDIAADFKKWKGGGLWQSLKKAVAEVKEEGGVPETLATPARQGAPRAAPRTLVLCAGSEAREAGEAVAAIWPHGNAAAEDASLSALAGAAQQRAQVVLAVECAEESGLSDASRGLAVQLGAAPMALQVQLRQLRFALLVVADTKYGNAGERASASASKAGIAAAAAPVQQALSKVGAKCLASGCLDMQDTDEAQLAELCATLSRAFADGPSATAPPGAAGALGTAVLRMAATASELPSEAPGEPADVLARFYFEAQKAKVLKVRELRQAPDAAAGLATAEVEIEVTGGLKGYSLGGTLSLLPESDPADVAAVLPLLGLVAPDLGKAVTFVAAEDTGVPVRRPFPTPCLLGEALSRYCDLGRAPTKKMLTALLPTLQDERAKESLGRLLADEEGLKLLQSAQTCLRMHEFWALLGVTRLNPSDFLLHCPRQRPREFTIASSPLAAPERITLCVSLSSHEAPLLEEFAQRLREKGCLPEAGPSAPSSRPRFLGLCSSWLTTRLRPGDIVLARQRPSALRLPERDVPVVMVAAGAGVAPFRGFWEELRRGPQAAPAALFFGCRHPEQDWLFREEMSGAVKLGAGCAALARMQVGPKRPLACLFTAFSRPGEGKKGCYVQDQVREKAESIRQWVDKMSGCVYICGSTAMGQGVLDALAEVLEGGRDAVERLRKEGRIVAEMWG